mgnify:CR=1 FL=1
MKRFAVRCVLAPSLGLDAIKFCTILVSSAALKSATLAHPNTLLLAAQHRHPSFLLIYPTVRKCTYTHPLKASPIHLDQRARSSPKLGAVTFQTAILFRLHGAGQPPLRASRDVSHRSASIFALPRSRDLPLVCSGGAPRCCDHSPVPRS